MLAVQEGQGTARGTDLRGAAAPLLHLHSQQVCLAASVLWDTAVISTDPWMCTKEERLFWAHTHQTPAALGEPCGLALHHPRQMDKSGPDVCMLPE